MTEGQLIVVCLLCSARNPPPFFEVEIEEFVRVAGIDSVSVGRRKYVDACRQAVFGECVCDLLREDERGEYVVVCQALGGEDVYIRTVCLSCDACVVLAFEVDFGDVGDCVSERRKTDEAVPSFRLYSKGVRRVVFGNASERVAVTKVWAVGAFNQAIERSDVVFFSLFQRVFALQGNVGGGAVCRYPLFVAVGGENEWVGNGDGDGIFVIDRQIETVGAQAGEGTCPLMIFGLCHGFPFLFVEYAQVTVADAFRKMLFSDVGGIYVFMGHVFQENIPKERWYKFIVRRGDVGVLSGVSLPVDFGDVPVEGIYLISTVEAGIDGMCPCMVAVAVSPCRCHVECGGDARQSVQQQFAQCIVPAVR